MRIFVPERKIFLYIVVLREKNAHTRSCTEPDFHGIHSVSPVPSSRSVRLMCIFVNDVLIIALLRYLFIYFNFIDMFVRSETRANKHYFVKWVVFSQISWFLYSEMAAPLIDFSFSVWMWLNFTWILSLFSECAYGQRLQLPLELVTLAAFGWAWNHSAPCRTRNYTSILFHLSV